MNKVVKMDGYLTIPIKSISGSAIGTATYPEPIYKNGIFQGTHIDVKVELWPSKMVGKDKKSMLIAARFGEMAMLRYVSLDRLTDITYYRDERKDNE